MSPSSTEAIERLSRISNPFDEELTRSTLEHLTADVPAIHRHAFDQCIALIEQVASRRQSAALLLCGESGSGKTHLLSRLRQQFEQEDASRAVFVSLPIHAHAGMLWRLVRLSLCDPLMSKKSEQWSLLEQVLVIRRSELDGVLNRDLAIVLENLLRGVHVRDSSAWLRGDPLPEAALAQLGLSAQPVAEGSREARCLDVIRELAQLIAPAPLVFLLDQVETGILALGQMVSTLRSTLSNAAILCSVPMALVDAIDGSENWVSQRVDLDPITWDEAQALVSARLDTRKEIAAIRPGDAHPLWPIDPEKLKPMFDLGESCLARNVLRRCREIYDEAAGGGASTPAEPVEAYLTRLFEARLRTPHIAESDFIIRNVLPSLLHALGMQPQDSDPPPSSGTFDLIIEHEGTPVVYAFRNQRPGVGLVSRFRRPGQTWDDAFAPRLVLLRDTRLGAGSNLKAEPGGDSGDRKAELVLLSPETLSALEALRSIFSSAGGGDLSQHGKPIDRNAVEAWVNTCLPGTLADFIDRLKNQNAKSCSFLAPALTAFLHERKVVRMEEAARELHVDLKEVAGCAHQNPLQFAVIEGSDPVLFEPVRRSAGG